MYKAYIGCYNHWSAQLHYVENILLLGLLQWKKYCFSVSNTYRIGYFVTHKNLGHLLYYDKCHSS